jgi:hypothetical protein
MADRASVPANAENGGGGSGRGRLGRVMPPANASAGQLAITRLNQSFLSTVRGPVRPVPLALEHFEKVVVDATLRPLARHPRPKRRSVDAETVRGPGASFAFDKSASKACGKRFRNRGVASTALRQPNLIVNIICNN